ncbi:MAG: hypothetical protein Q4A15_05965 [Prevotellaceae bacterium]|nr:hypothetical protein [Prevotellaceae bacterium]
MRNDGTQTIGMTDGYNHIIYIASNLKGRLLETVLAHELCHAIIFSYDIELDAEFEEWLAQFVATYGREVVYLLDKLLENIHLKSQ